VRRKRWSWWALKWHGYMFCGLLGCIGLTQVDSFMVFVLPVFIKELRRKCVTAAKALSIGTG